MPSWSSIKAAALFMCLSTLCLGFVSVVLLAQMPAVAPWRPFFAIGLLAPIAMAQTWTPLRPHSVPLAVRSPYLNVWLPSTDSEGSGNLAERWATFWLGMDHQWAGLILVDGSPYVWMGNLSSDELPMATQTAVTITATQSRFELTAGPVNVTATFLSPIEGEDLVKTSLPFSYLQVAVESNTGTSHNVSIYTDVSGAWLVGAAPELTRQAATVGTQKSGNTVVHIAELVDQTPFVQANHMILQGQLVYAALETGTSGLTYQSGQDNVLRGAFVAGSALADTVDNVARPLKDRPLVLAFAQTLHIAETGSSSVLFGVGHARSPTISLLGTNRSSYYFSKYSTAQAAMSDFLNDYANVLSRATQLDDSIQIAATEIAGADYATLCAMSLRQAFGAQELTIGGNETTGWDSSDVMLFQEEIGSTGYLNTVDVIYPTMPALLVVAPKLLQYMIEPLLYVQSLGNYPEKYAMHDLGLAYPLATGNYPDMEVLPLEECGNMIIMSLAAAQANRDTSQLARYLSLFDQWGDYLQENGLTPGLQASTDDFFGMSDNSTNLAVKALVGLQALSQIHTLLGSTAQAQKLSSVVQSWLPQFYSFATSADATHLLLNYGNESSWLCPYNMFGDRLLGLGVFPDSLYASQDAFYAKQAQPYGIPLDSRESATKTDWAAEMAAITTTNATRDLFISGLVNYIANTADPLHNALADFYYTGNGTEAAFLNRPVVGGHFALLAMEKLNRTLLFT